MLKRVIFRESKLCIFGYLFYCAQKTPILLIKCNFLVKAFLQSEHSTSELAGLCFSLRLLFHYFHCNYLIVKYIFEGNFFLQQTLTPGFLLSSRFFSLFDFTNLVDLVQNSKKVGNEIRTLNFTDVWELMHLLFSSTF